MKFGSLDWFAYTLVLIGALNWGLVGIFDFILVTASFGAASVLTKVTYVAIGFAALYAGFFSKKSGK